MSRLDSARRLPHSSEIERSLLGGLLLAPDRLADVRDAIEPRDFHRPQHRALYELLLRLTDTRGGYDLALILDEVSQADTAETVGGIPYLVGMPNACPSPEAIEVHVGKVRDLAFRRRLILASYSIIDRAADSTIDGIELVTSAEQAIREVSVSAKVNDPRTAEELALAERAAIAQRKVDRMYAEATGRSGVLGVATGYRTLDAICCGFRPADLILLAARPAMGKTALSLNIALSAALDGVPVGVFSLEMSGPQLMGRLFSTHAGVYYDRVHGGRTDTRDDDRLDQSAEVFARLPLVVDDEPALTIAQISARARRMHHQRKLGLIVVDYLQIIKVDRAKGANTNDLIGQVSMGLKTLAKSLDVPVLALSQLNRQCETRADKRPIMADLRDSGSLEQDADKILFLYRDEVYNPDSSARGVAEVDVKKNRAGATGVAAVAWDGAYQTFRNLEKT